MSYTFFDSNASVLTADSALNGSAHQPVVQIGSILGAMSPYALSANLVSATSSVLTGTNPTSLLSAPGTGLRNYLTAIKVTNAASAGVIVDIKDSGGNVLDTGYAAASGGGWASSFLTPIKQTTTNASIDVQPRAQASILVAISGFIGT